MLVFCKFSKKRIKISLSKNFLLLKCLKSLIYNWAHFKKGHILKWAQFIIKMLKNALYLMPSKYLVSTISENLRIMAWYGHFMIRKSALYHDADISDTVATTQHNIT